MIPDRLPFSPPHPGPAGDGEREMVCPGCCLRDEIPDMRDACSRKKPEASVERDMGKSRNVGSIQGQTGNIVDKVGHSPVDEPDHEQVPGIRTKPGLVPEPVQMPLIL